jgi:4-amino-4-deoxy-L-arabinose transferase-like glycosyltransferase
MPPRFELGGMRLPRYQLGNHSEHPADAAKEGGMLREGLRVLYNNHRYQLTLTASRLGVLPFFWLACLAVYWWAVRCCGLAAAVVAVFLFTSQPTILAHAGLSTTDMALTAFTGLAFVAGLRWIEGPGLGRAVLFGLAVAVGVLSKFSFLACFPAAVSIALFWYWIQRRSSLTELLTSSKARAATLLTVVLVSCVVCWAGYRFSVGKSADVAMTVPAPELFQGIHDVAKHNEEGHLGYLLGERSRNGFLLFFPVALAVKTPVPYLILLGLGIALVRRKQEKATALWQRVAILAVGMARARI